jgi:hypothetical protein
VSIAKLGNQRVSNASSPTRQCELPDTTVSWWVTVAPGEPIIQHSRDFGSHYGRRFTFIRE